MKGMFLTNTGMRSTGVYEALNKSFGVHDTPKTTTSYFSFLERGSAWDSFHL